MAARVSLLLRGLSLAFGVRLRTAKLWRPYAERGLREAQLSLGAITPKLTLRQPHT